MCAGEQRQQCGEGTAQRSNVAEHDRAPKFRLRANGNETKASSADPNVDFLTPMFLTHFRAKIFVTSSGNLLIFRENRYDGLHDPSLEFGSLNSEDGHPLNPQCPVSVGYAPKLLSLLGAQTGQTCRELDESIFDVAGLILEMPLRGCSSG
jgi:hypothetical protein